MSRFEKKCFIGSASFHGLLLVVFVFGAAFLPSKSNDKLPPVITIIDAKVTDRLVASGGNPNGNPNPPPPKPIEQPQPAPLPPPVDPPKKVVPEPKREEIKPKESVKQDTPKKQDKTEVVQKESKPKISTTLVKHTNDVVKTQREIAQRAAQAKADRDYREAMAKYNEQRSRIAKEIGGVVGDVSRNLGRTTVAEPIGPGGAAYVNYNSLVVEIYKRAIYATHPQSDQDAEAVIRVSVTRDGIVRNSQWVRRTGNSVLDKAVDRAMTSVRSLPEFPPETKDSERSFKITIAFEAKRVSA